jgi:hypothetical protein
MMDLGTAFAYPTKDKNWIVKAIIGAIVSVIPIVNFIAYGFGLRAIKQIVSGNEDSLPEWDNWGEDFVKGLTAWLGGLLYSVPIIVVVICINIASAILGDTLGTILQCCLAIPLFVYGIAIIPLLTNATVRYAVTDNFQDAFLDFGARFSEVQNHVGESVTYLIYALILGIGMGIAVGLTIWICGLGLAVAWLGSMMNIYLATHYSMGIGVVSSGTTSSNVM